MHRVWMVAKRSFRRPVSMCSRFLGIIGIEIVTFVALLFSVPFVGFCNSPFVDAATPAGALPYSGGTNWVLDFSDEFNGSSLDTSKWGVDVSTKSRNPRPGQGIADWWWRSENVSLDGSGNLVLDVVKHDHNTMYCGSIHSTCLQSPCAQTASPMSRLKNAQPHSSAATHARSTAAKSANGNPNCRYTCLNSRMNSRAMK